MNGPARRCREAAPVLWYVHDHGTGHLARARAVIPHLRHGTVVAAGPAVADVARDELDGPVVGLPGDVPATATPTVGPWHHAPSGQAVRQRSLALVDAVATFGCTVAVVDVSMEVTVLARLCGLRVVTVRQSGCRSDAAHRIGLASADVVWVPQHRELEPIGDEVAAVDDRWHFTGAFSRFDGSPHRVIEADGTRLALIVVGAGGTGLDLGAWRAATAPPGWRVVIAGAPDQWCHRGITSVGRIDDLAPLLRTADVVVASAGWGAVADAAATDARLVVVPETRPFAEQEARAGALAGHHLAVVRPHWPAAAELDDLAAAVARLPAGRWARYYDGHGAERAAAMIDAEVAR